MNTKALMLAESLDEPAKVQTTVGRSLRLRCPVCGHSEPSLTLTPGVLREPSCCYCGFTFVQESIIWKAITPGREERFQQFIIEDEMIRLREGRGSAGAHYYLELPYTDATGRNARQWKMRSRSFGFFYHYILPWLESRYRAGLDVLDIGAGNCWLSYRLALRGHRPTAVDLRTNTLEGLGAAHHYLDFLPKLFELFQAEMDRLPFDDRQFDLAVFNASFHYSENYARTLQETLRCLRRPGHLLIIDSPLYRDEESGQNMLEEKRLKFQGEYGFPSDSMRSRGYLTPDTLDELARVHAIQWKRFEPRYGAPWALRSLKARLLRRREPPKFCVLWARLGDS
jgi:SAM-dependent methyltransferase